MTTDSQSLSEWLRGVSHEDSNWHGRLQEAADALDAATVDTTKLNAGQLVQRIMRAMDGDVSEFTTASLAEHIAAEILKLPKDYWYKPSPPPPGVGGGWFSPEFVKDAVLRYVADMTYCDTDGNWRFKPGYDPQCVLDALARKTYTAGTTIINDGRPT